MLLTFIGLLIFSVYVHILVYQTLNIIFSVVLPCFHYGYHECMFVDFLIRSSHCVHY